MIKKVQNNKGFTLIELLAVIVILGILMIVAIPAVTKYIANSRRDAFADNAGAYINSARYMLLNDELVTYSTSGSREPTVCQAPANRGEYIYILTKDIDLDKGTDKSSFGYAYNESSYVSVTWDGSKLEYSVALIDSQNNGTKVLTKEKDLGRGVIYPKTGELDAPPGASTGNRCGK